MTDTPKDDWPTLGEELARKGLEQLEFWMAKRDAGKITQRELFIVTQVLYAVMSGLAPWEATTLVTEVNQEIRVGAKVSQGQVD